MVEFTAPGGPWEIDFVKQQISMLDWSELSGKVNIFEIGTNY